MAPLPVSDRGPSWAQHLKYLTSLIPKGTGLTEQVWNQRHRWVLGILALHILGLPTFGLLFGQPVTYLIAAAVILGGIAAIAAEPTLSRTTRTSLTTVGLVTCSAILIFFSGGHIETHFHFFVMITFVALYQEWTQFVLYLALVMFHHLILGLIAPTTIYDQHDAISHPVLWALVHGGGILVEIVGLLFYWRGFELEQSNCARVEERLRLSTEAARIGIWDWDIQTNTIYWDSRMLSLYGISEAQFSGNYRGWRNAVIQEDLARVEGELQAALRNDAQFDTEFRIRWPNGDLRHVKANGLIVFHPNGTPLRAVGISYDITAHKEVESALLERETYLLAVLHHAVTGVIVIDEQGIIERFNPFAQGIFGYREEEILGQNVRMLMPEPYRTEHDRYIHNYCSSNMPRVIGRNREVIGLRKDGSEFPIDLAIGEVRLHNRRIFIGMIRDITDVKDNEARLEEAAVELECRNAELETAQQQILLATQAKSDFLASMSHEIRTPMNAITAMAELLDETPLTPEQGEFVHRLRMATSHLLDLINDVLDLSKIESGHLTLEATPFDLPALVETVGELLAPRAHAKSIELITHIPSHIPHRVIGDPTRLRQILVNLVGNAVKFTEHGQVLLRVESANLAHIRFSVSDTGIGIPNDKLTSIFSSFSQVDASTTRKYGGTGLGLNISKRLAELMGGAIAVTSTLGHGSTFHVTIPLPSSMETPRSVSPILSATNRRILLVDDNTTSRHVITEILSGAGAAVTESQSGPAALEAIQISVEKGQHVHLMIVDRRMPDMDGLETIRLTREIPGYRHIPIILLTSSMLKDDRDRCADLKVDYQINKPVSRANLLGAVANALTSTSQPLVRPPQAVPRLPKAAALLPSSADLPPLRILLVEDLEINRDIIFFFLKDVHASIDIADNGAVAVELFQVNTYDLVFMDVQMPVMDGLEATRTIREWEQAHHREPTPIIALTAHALKEEMDKSLAAGCTAHVTKPVAKPTLMTAISTYATRQFRQAAQKS
ncbi:MAG: response regulator [Nitrospira sp.]|nr:response regulator [Nitrospira sp.]